MIAAVVASRSVSNLTDNHFSLFGLPLTFSVDTLALELAYKNVQAKVHPDHFGAASAAERRIAMQWAARANEAYAVLRSPLKRAAYLCELNGTSIEAESNTAMPRDFMLQQMEWREALDAARQPFDAAQVSALHAELQRSQETLQSEVVRAIDEHKDMSHAAALVRQWMFVERFGEDVQRVLHAAEDAAQSSLKSA